MQPFRLLAYVVVSLVVLVLGVAVPSQAGDRKVTLTSVPITQGSAYFSSSSGSSPQQPGLKCPDGSTQVGAADANAMQCQWDGGRNKKSSVEVYAVLGMTDGTAYAVRLSCVKDDGVCTRPEPRTQYDAELSEDTKWLARYGDRTENGPMKVKFSTEGKLATYSILELRKITP